MFTDIFHHAGLDTARKKKHDVPSAQLYTMGPFKTGQTPAKYYSWKDDTPRIVFPGAVPEKKTF